MNRTGNWTDTFRNPARLFVVGVLVTAAAFTVNAIWCVNQPGHRVQIEDTRSLLRMIEIALEVYRQDVGHYPRGNFPDLAKVLLDPTYGWKNAGKAWFPDRDDLKDAWGMDLQYCCHEEYARSGRGIERRPNSGDYYNPDTFQLYSLGPNMKTWPSSRVQGGRRRLGGTEPDDIRNWVQEQF